MKLLPLLTLFLLSAILFFGGMSVPGPKSFWQVTMVVAGVILGFIFYLITFIHAIKTPTLNSGKRMFWIVAIVCVPMIGNLVYLLLQSAFTKRQIPKPQNW
jgi:hypothetical protein